jgi:hypothetical protein
MTESQAWRGARVRAVSFQGRGAPQRRWHPGGLWAWLHAPALLDGAAAGAADLAENDSRRLAARRAALPGP